MPAEDRKEVADRLRSLINLSRDFVAPIEGLAGLKGEAKTDRSASGYDECSLNRTTSIFLRKAHKMSCTDIYQYFMSRLIIYAFFFVLPITVLMIIM